MRKLPILLILLPLIACTVTTPSADIQPTMATSTLPVTETSPPPTSPPPTPPAESGPLPRISTAFTLGDTPQVCAGSALAVEEETGYIYTAGTGASLDSPCLTVIDPSASQALETHSLPFAPWYLRWDGGTLYAIGEDDVYDLAIADAGTGEIVTRGNISGANGFGILRRLVVRDGWAYAQSDTDLSPIPLVKGAEWPIPILDVTAFDLADDGRIAVVSGSETTTARVYAGVDGTLLAEREIGPGQAGESLAFVGQTDRIFAIRKLSQESPGSPRSFVDVLDAMTLETIHSTEEWVHGLTADPDRGRAYAFASEGRLLGFDAGSGQMLGVVFNIPQGDPEGFTVYDPYEKLHITPATGHAYHVYTDFDGGTWAATFDLTTGTGASDLRVPSQTWALDVSRDRLYFSGYAFFLALDATTLQSIWRLPLSRDPVSAALAPEHNLLIIGDAGGDVRALDLQTYAELQRMPGVGGYVDVDLAHGWLYAGDAFAPGIAVYDLATLDLRGVIPQPGRPTASPADGLVYILEEDVYSGDGETLTVIEGRTTRNAGCNSCDFPTSVVVDPTSGITLTTTYGIWVGKAGPTSSASVDPRTGRAFVARTSGGYRVVNTLAAYADLTLEHRLAWCDGLYGQPLYSPATDHLYVARDTRLLVLKGETLDLVGWLHPSSERLTPAAVDAHSGRLYLLAGPQVLVLEGAGGQPEMPPPRSVSRLPGPPEAIIPLPNRALFVRAYDRDTYASAFFRSTDGGESWEQIRGGLPGAPNDLAVAPDGTLYAAAVPVGWREETDNASIGDGVYRSQDGGASWELFSRGLAHLRVERVHAADDGEIYTLANGMWPDQQAWSVTTVWRLGEDDRWAQVEVPEAGPYVVADGSLPFTHTQALDQAWLVLTGGGDLHRSWGDELQRSSDAGATWKTVGSGPADYAVQVLACDGDLPDLYWLTWDALYRSTDLGASWAQLVHPALADSAPAAIALEKWNGEETLFLGTEAGEVLVLPTAEADWR